MLSEGTLKYLRKVFLLTRILGSQSYRWPLDGDHKAQFTTSRFRYSIYLAQLLLFCAYQSFIFGRWIHAVFFDPWASQRRRVGLQYVACSYMVPVTFQLITFFNYGRHHSFVNRLLDHCRLFESRKMASNFLNACIYIINSTICGNRTWRRVGQGSKMYELHGENVLRWPGRDYSEHGDAVQEPLGPSSPDFNHSGRSFEAQMAAIASRWIAHVHLVHAVGHNVFLCFHCNGLQHGTAQHAFLPPVSFLFLSCYLLP